MQIRKELFLFCILLLFSIGLLVAANTELDPSKPCANNSKDCKSTVPDSGVSPWMFLTEGFLRIASV
jgi:hypothetical protein